MNYGLISDEELIDIYKEENGEESEALKELLSRYTAVVNNKANKFFAVGSEKNDIKQEGMIGLLSAIKNFDSKKSNTSFKTFANICIDRKLISLIKSANRQKQMPLNYAISLNKKVGDYVDENDNELMEVLDNGYNPFDEYIDKEYYKGIADSLYSKLSNHERSVLEEYLKGKSYAEIAQKLNCQAKSVDTALTRIRKKGSEVMRNYNI